MPRVTVSLLTTSMLSRRSGHVVHWGNHASYTITPLPPIKAQVSWGEAKNGSEDRAGGICTPSP